MDTFDEGLVELLNAMEVDLQAMWMYSYCLYNNTDNSVIKMTTKCSHKMY